MQAEIEICKVPGCGLEISGMEDYKEYYSESITSDLLAFTYLDSITLTGLYKIDSEGEKTLEEVMINKHEQEEIDGKLYNSPDVTSFSLSLDGQYEIVHVVLPTVDGLNTCLELQDEETEVSELLENIYASDGVKVYKYVDDEYLKVEFTEIFENYDCENEYYSNIAYTSEITFSMCKIERCYFMIASLLLHEYCPANCNKSSLSDLIWKRDLLWMAINVIKYLLELGNYNEAQRILEQFLGCNDFCLDDGIKNGGSSCGCSSKSEKSSY